MFDSKEIQLFHFVNSSKLRKYWQSTVDQHLNEYLKLNSNEKLFLWLDFEFDLLILFVDKDFSRFYLKDCNLILFDVVIERVFVNEIKCSLVEDWEFNSFSNSIRADSFNELFVGWFWVVKDEIEIVERGIPFETAFWFPVESKFVFNWESVLTECWWKIKFS